MFLNFHKDSQKEVSKDSMSRALRRNQKWSDHTDVKRRKAGAKASGKVHLCIIPTFLKEWARLLSWNS